MVRVSEAYFVSANGRRPRGEGNWAFCPWTAWKSDRYLESCFWFNGLYSEAKRAAQVHFKKLGVVDVVVCS